MSSYVALAIVIVIFIVWEDPDRLWVSLVFSVYLFNRFSVFPKAIKTKCSLLQICLAGKFNS